jgi:hypothetical protein
LQKYFFFEESSVFKKELYKRWCFYVLKMLVAILVLGGTRFIGPHCSERLSDVGHEQLAIEPLKLRPFFIGIANASIYRFNATLA